MILEKAYAKLYGNYNYIEAGKVQYALSDMTNGFPEQIDLKKESMNQASFWEKLKAYSNRGSLMGAGTPEHEIGDAFTNELGIVAGHAYAVMEIAEIDNFKLVKLRNPHGHKGAEWNGDWGDNDKERWNTRYMQKLKHTNAQDGLFWMELDDFIEQYSYLYVCHILSHQDGWNS